jgi:hypothetical protein
MTFVKLLAEGFSAARRHPRLVLIAYLVPLLPALALAVMAKATIAPVFDYSLLAQQVLDGSWNGVWSDFAASPANHMSVVLGSGVMLALLLTALIRIPVAAGIAEVLIEGDAAQPHPFLTGVAQHTWRFARSAVWFLVTAALTAGVIGATVAGFFKLAEKRSDARLDVIGFAVAGLLALLILAIFQPAYDLARLAAARHDDRKTLRGFLRAIWTVLRHPGIFLPLVASFVLLIAALHLGYYAARSPWTPATAAAILALFAAQQLVMGVRAVFHVASWGAELAAYRTLGEPRFCEQRQRKLLVIDEPVQPAVTAVERLETPPAPAAPEPYREPADDPFPEPASPPADDVFTPTSAS